jgi:hypothetical protein
VKIHVPQLVRHHRSQLVVAEPVEETALEGQAVGPVSLGERDRDEQRVFGTMDAVTARRLEPRADSIDEHLHALGLLQVVVLVAVIVRERSRPVMSRQHTTSTR